MASIATTADGRTAFDDVYQTSEKFGKIPNTRDREVAAQIRDISGVVFVSWCDVLGKIYVITDRPLGFEIWEVCNEFDMNLRDGTHVDHVIEP